MPRLQMMMMVLLATLTLAACTSEPPPPPPPPASAAIGNQPADTETYVGKDTIYDTQFKALHDAKQLEAKMNEDAARLDEQIDPERHPPQPPQ